MASLRVSAAQTRTRKGLHRRVVAAVVEGVHALGDENLLEVDAPVERTVAHDVPNVGDELRGAWALCVRVHRD